MAFEELGPTFVKLGQVLATRPDLVPEDFVEEFKRLHDQVSALPFETVERVLESELGGADRLRSVFRAIDRTPLGAASIAQVHRAELASGEPVVLKVQRPGVVELIQNDIGVLYTIADLLERYVPEARLFNPVGIVDEFFKTLELETNFLVEANNLRRFHDCFRDDAQIKIPKVYPNLSSRRVLVLEALDGIPLSDQRWASQSGVNRAAVMKAGVDCYFRQVFEFGLFHGDLHAGNLFVLPDSRIGLIDFGIVGRLNRRIQGSIASLFLALYTEDYEGLAFEYVSLAAGSDRVDVDEFSKDLQDLLAPYHGMLLSQVNLGRLLLDSTAIAARHELTLPRDLLLFFKSIVAVESMGREISPDFDLLGHALQYADKLVKDRFDPQRLKSDGLALAKDGLVLLRVLPRQLHQMIKRLNNPDFAHQLSLVQLDELKRSLEKSTNLLFLGLVISGLIVGGSILLSQSDQDAVWGMSTGAAVLFGLATLFGSLGFINYISKDRS